MTLVLAEAVKNTNIVTGKMNNNYIKSCHLKQNKKPVKYDNSLNVLITKQSNKYL